MTNAGAPPPLFAPPSITVGRPRWSAGSDGMVLRSAEKLGDYPVTVLHSVREHARTAPEQLLVAERQQDPATGWRTCGYGAAVRAANSIGQALLDRGLGLGPGPDPVPDGVIVAGKMA
jgi:hypothetical protein